MSWPTDQQTNPLCHDCKLEGKDTRLTDEQEWAWVNQHNRDHTVLPRCASHYRQHMDQIRAKHLQKHFYK